MRLWQTKSKVEAAEAKYQESTGVASALEYCEYVLRAVGTDLWLCFLPPVGAAERDGCGPGLPNNHPLTAQPCR